MTHLPRPARPDELPSVARLWYDGWQDAHAAIVPAELVAIRTLPRFAERLAGFGDRLRVAGPEGAPLGLCVVKGAEIDQLFVAREARGSGLAGRLLADGEARLRATGITVGRLDCAMGNARAIRFYRKHGWGGERPETVTLDGPFSLRVTVMEKALLPAFSDP